MLFQLWNAFAFMECFCNYGMLLHLRNAFAIMECFCIYGMLLHLWNAFAYNVDVVLLLPLEHAFAVDEGGVTLLPRLFLYLSLFFFLIINVLFGSMWCACLLQCKCLSLGSHRRPRVADRGIGLQICGLGIVYPRRPLTFAPSTGCRVVGGALAIN